MSASSKFFQSSKTMRAYSNQFLNRMKGWMEDHPVVSNSLLCLNLWIAGDALAQYSEHQLKQQQSHHHQHQDRSMSTKTPAAETDTTTVTTASAFKYDYRRTAECASYGAFFIGPLLAVWYPYLDRLCNRYTLTARYGLWAAPIAKVLADEFLMDPPCLVAFYGYMNFCEGGNITTFQNKLENEFMRSWLTSLAVWPPVLLGTFRFLPVYAQAPVINVCCIIWDGFLSHRNAVARIKEEAEKNKSSDEKEQDDNARE